MWTLWTFCIWFNKFIANCKYLINWYGEEKGGILLCFWPCKNKVAREYSERQGEKKESLMTTSTQQSHYKEVLRWEIFMEQELRFVLDLGWLAVLKKRVWADYEQLLRVVFSCFQGKKMLLEKLCTVSTKKLHEMKLKKNSFFSLKKLKRFVLKFFIG